MVATCAKYIKSRFLNFHLNNGDHKRVGRRARSVAPLTELQKIPTRALGAMSPKTLSTSERGKSLTSQKLVI